MATITFAPQNGAFGRLTCGNKLLFISNTSAIRLSPSSKNKASLRKAAPEKTDYSERAPNRRRTTPAEAQ